MAVSVGLFYFCSSLSALMDERPTRDERREIEMQERIVSLAADARKKVRSEITRRRKLIANLEGDLAQHGDPERWRRFGDLLLANVVTATRDGETFIVIDHFSDEAPLVAIEAPVNRSVSETAEAYFRRYAKARNGREMISSRIKQADRDIEALISKLIQIDTAESNGDEGLLVSFTAKKRVATETRKAKKNDAEVKGVRKFVSTDGFEILVGKAARDNEFLTFRIAKSLDTWLHAADFPGSHVVIRNPNRKEIPQRTIIEAAALAAFYSGARALDKAAVNYTQRKFVSKIKGGTPGAVRLAAFKTLMAEPKVPPDDKDLLIRP